ncbi:hypothetical protein [Amycolatopsis sp. FDAARGOS 1241]|uniref:hypothetical protein n=1 Tax=Amycolatopsis sp. FDAARGOS 1241 TaxID=2778070 RepID=UPI001EF1F6CA|nr:hypothetical protein [Amycolatopsis sp. FDAARGOS 1241]
MARHRGAGGRRSRESPPRRRPAPTHYRSAEFFLDEHPADPRIAYGYDRSVECFHRAIAGFEGIEPVEIPTRVACCPAASTGRRAKAPSRSW